MKREIINIQSISRESKKPLFFRKNFGDGEEEKIEKWQKKLDDLNVPKNYSRRFPEAEFNN